MTEPSAGGADEVADRRWQRVRGIAADIARLEALDRREGLDDDARMELARLRIPIPGSPISDANLPVLR